MSSESKKKRGESGVSNAASTPFRGNGRRPARYFDNSLGVSYHPCGAGSALVNAMRLGCILPGFDPSQRLLDMTDAAMARCTSPHLV
mgnify:CR=1 FL=1